MDIHIHREGQDSGPFSPGQVREFLTSGELSPTDLAWYEGAPDWTPLSELPPSVLPAPKTLATVRPAVPVVLQRVPPPMPVVSTKNCPFCAEPIKMEAMKCKHCGETLDPRLRAAEEATRAKSQQPNVYMNAAVGLGAPQKHSFPHGMHLIATLLTAGFWLPIWLLHYLFRSRSYYD